MTKPFAIYMSMMLPLALSASVRPEPVTANAVAEMLRTDSGPTGEYSLTATLALDYNPVCGAMAVTDATGSALLFAQDIVCEDLKAGDVISAKIRTRKYQPDVTTAHVISLKRVARSVPPAPSDATGEELCKGTFDYRAVRVFGTVHDIARDETDSRYLVMNLNCAGTFIRAPIAMGPADDALVRTDLVGSRVSVVGFCNPKPGGSRYYTGRRLMVDGLANVHKENPPGWDRFDVPGIGELLRTDPSRYAFLGQHKARGRVIAVLGNGRIMVRHRNSPGVMVELLETRSPAYGDEIEAVGFPVSDLFNVSLIGSVWRKSEGYSPPLKETARRISAKDLYTGASGTHGINPAPRGTFVTVTGRIIRLPTSPLDNGTLLLESDEYLISVNAVCALEAFEGVSEGCEVEITGTHVLEAEQWSQNRSFPSVRGVSIVMRRASDLKIVSHPPWWTPARLLGVVGSLLAVLAALLLWNRSLRILAEKRSRELAEESVARIKSELKTGERTNLAVELHDSLGQNLTGVSYEITAARKDIDNGGKKTKDHLDIAAKILNSCRTELRDCLRDLRNCTLEEHDMAEAVRRTLAPHLCGAAVDVRFPVSRDGISDNTAHAILMIVRELVSNAVRHGHATEISVDGCLKDGILSFRVGDNGCGFDPATAPGMLEGHFGLQGVGERIESLNGSMSVSSAPGEGAVFRISVPLDGKDRMQP